MVQIEIFEDLKGYVAQLKDIVEPIGGNLGEVVSIKPSNEWLFVGRPFNMEDCQKEDNATLYHDEKSNTRYVEIEYFLYTYKYYRTDWLNLNFYECKDFDKILPFLKVNCIDGYYWEVFIDSKKMISNIISSLNQKSIRYRFVDEKNEVNPRANQ